VTGGTPHPSCTTDQRACVGVTGRNCGGRSRPFTPPACPSVLSNFYVPVRSSYRRLLKPLLHLRKNQSC